MSCSRLETDRDKVMWGGDWSSLTMTVCGGDIEVWDQTIGCTECGQNLWHLPESADQWPIGDEENCPEPRWWERRWEDDESVNPYDPYFRVFEIRHPFSFFDCHDPGDEDREGDCQWLRM